MPSFSSVLVVIAVAAGAFGVLAALLSYFRYQRWLFEAEEETQSTCSLESARLLITDRLRKGPIGLIKIQLPHPPSSENLTSIKDGLRKQDQVWQIEDGSLWILVKLDPEHLPTVADRVQMTLQSNGFNSGHQDLHYLRASALDVEHTLQNLSGKSLKEGWTRTPIDWPSAPETPPPIISPAIDPLTQTLAISRTPRALRGILARHRKYNQPLTILRADVDRLDEYNAGPDGQDAGDAVLQKTAQLIMKHCRETDLVARLEEDDFLICLPEKPEKALLAAQRISRAVKETPLNFQNQHLRFTLSIGLAGFPEHGESPRTLITAAGWAQKAAKSRGRGSCLVFNQEMQPKSLPADKSEQPADTF